MKLFDDFYSENEITQFVQNSSPDKEGNLHLIKGEEDAGWVDLYFEYNKTPFKVIISLAISDLSDLVLFFENLINEESATFLDNEVISTPLLYACPIDEEKIRFLIADCERINDLLNDDKIDEDDLKGIFDYDIKCDVILDKNILLKEFYRTIKNIINSCNRYEENIYNIGYDRWKDSLKNILNYLKN